MLPVAAGIITRLWPLLSTGLRMELVQKMGAKTEALGVSCKTKFVDDDGHDTKMVWPVREIFRLGASSAPVEESIKAIGSATALELQISGMTG